ncbi:hypothetical protein [Desertivirga brevis]|uniref:hypothetical protein n=1 Tax=Desertivirga brevis TaxID=2810310 RepID=UPI001A957E14|nr:hypothetical protein [Pedobacter sp. SYSU D00873]
MKTLYTLILAIAFASCTSGPEKAKSELAENEQDTIKQKKTAAEKTKKMIPNIYIDAIEYFPETNEFFVSLPFLKEVDFKMFEKIGEQADSIIFQSDETTRSRLPIKVAQLYFDLTLLDTLNIYDSAHNFITGAKFVRVEYYQPTIESSFIAVFKPENISSEEGKEKFYYCTSLVKKTEEKIRAVEKTSSSLTNKIIQELGLKVKYQWASEHIKLIDEGSTLSILAITPENENKISSYLTELKNGKLKILNEYKGEDAFWQILPLPLEHNKRPVLLITLAVPDSDVSPFYLPFIWENSGYRMVQNKFICNKSDKEIF